MAEFITGLLIGSLLTIIAMFIGEYYQKERKIIVWRTEQEVYYQCPKCKRESCIVHLDKRCVFCEREEGKPIKEWLNEQRKAGYIKSWEQVFDTDNKFIIEFA